ncbi:SMC-Scp complex subunit ScpB [Deinococcus irradiatisoli]|uniref:SMC-Scp complex subunit ScpB n=1 Tax=Deinococcus irradiatisoli TaxID=2202254 RepID=A0A2Z3JCS7_9DEIO|nr:SMC-Scp complex subunit ScpB [Deinococcus irradiatisoli]AWN22977.1 SMC-Scp complex subunit ScpB [Deinococcus irradiatisoli]
MKALIGAALLAAGRPVRAAELAQLLGVPETQARRQLQRYAEEVQAADLGFVVEEVAGGFRLVVLPALAQQLAPLLSPPPLPTLSGAALEVLAIIAYRQPVTRAEIEAMRGGSAGTVMTLQERELIKVVGRADAVGQPLLYGTTERFLLEFGLKSLADLPELLAEGAEFSQLLRG